jgi:hypothetical protein
MAARIEIPCTVLGKAIAASGGRFQRRGHGGHHVAWPGHVAEFHYGLR